MPCYTKDKRTTKYAGKDTHNTRFFTCLTTHGHTWLIYKKNKSILFHKRTPSTSKLNN